MSKGHIVRNHSCRLNIIYIIVELLTEHHLEFLSLKVGFTGSSESIHVKRPQCWKSHVAAQLKITDQPEPP